MKKHVYFCSCPFNQRRCFSQLPELAMLLQRSAALKPSAQQDRLLSTLQDFGDNALVISGLHENMGSMRFRDTNLRGSAAITGRLCDADQFMATCHRRMDFSLQKYVPVCALAIRSIAAGPERCVQVVALHQWHPALFHTQAQRVPSLHAAEKMLPSLSFQ